MSELNREQIKKALECCASEVTKDLNCGSCPMHGRVNCMTILYSQALALINELTEENKAQAETIENLQKVAKHIQAITVHNMRERLKDGHTTAVNPNVICLYESELDQIAKEILEEDQK